MASIPGKGRVSRALKTVEREVKNACNRVNQKAAKLLARGDYEGAETLVDLGRRARGFGGQVSELTRTWRSLKSSIRDETVEKLEPTPAWKLYKPILRALVENGGAMTWNSVEGHLSSSAEFQPLPGDLVTRKGRPLWARTARKARSGLIEEGFIEKTGGMTWKVTASGRKAAETASK